MEFDPKAGDNEEDDVDIDVERLVIDTHEQDKGVEGQDQENENDSEKEEENEEQNEEAEETDEESEEEGIYHVERIKGMQIFGKTLKYKVRWEGYGSDDDTWEPASNLIGDGAQKLLKAYRKKHKENVERLEGNLRGAAAKQSGAPKAGWKYINADDFSTGDCEQDRELKLDDRFYDESVSELKGEKKHLVDLTRRVTSNERFLAEIGSRERVTRKTLKALRGHTAINKMAPSTRRCSSVSARVSIKKQKGRMPIFSTPSSSTSSSSSSSSLGNNNNNNNVADMKPTKKKVRTAATKLFSAKEPDVLSCLNEVIDSSESRSGSLSSDEEKLRIAAGGDPAKKRNLYMNEELIPSSDDDEVFNYMPYASTSLYEMPVTKDIDWESLFEHPSPEKMDDPPFDFREAVMSGDAQNFLDLKHAMTPEKFAQNCAFTEPDSGMNYLHKLCAMPCDLSHGVCDIVGIICKTAGERLLKQQNDHGKTPLHIAVVNGLPCCVRVLLRYGASLNIADNYRQTPVESAYSSNNPDVWRAILRVGANYTRMVNAQTRVILDGQEEILEEHSEAVDSLLKATREKVLYGSRELRVLSPVFTSPFHDGPQFLFYMDYKDGSLPGTAVIKLMCFVCSFNGTPDKWTARCWGGLHIPGHPKLNGTPLVPACDDYFPMIYHCPLQNGRNQISVTCANADTNSLVFVAQVVAFEPNGAQPVAPTPLRFGF